MEQKSILIIDRQNSWREAAATALRSSGYMVYTQDKYDSEFIIDSPDLIIFGCVRIRSAERRFIKKLMVNKLHLLVLSSSLPWSLVRPLFLDGVEDVTEKPYQKDRILKAVEEVFDNMSPKDAFHERRKADL